MTAHQRMLLVMLLLDSLLGPARAFSAYGTNDLRAGRSPASGFVTATTTLLSSLAADSPNGDTRGVVRDGVVGADEEDDEWMDLYRQYCNYTLHSKSEPPPLHHPVLGKWIRTQRRQYRLYQQGEMYSLDDDRILLLQKANFVSDVLEQKWLKKYQLLLEFIQHHGHARVPSNHSGGLGSWSKTQRRYYKLYLQEERSTSLTPKRIDALNAVDFCWNLHEYNFRNKVEQASVRKGEEWKVSDGPIGLWYSNIKTRYRKYCLDNDSHCLKDYEISLLERELGFSCDTILGIPDPQLPEFVEWQDRFQQLCNYKEQYGHTNVPRDCVEYPKLGTWVHKVRERYNPNLHLSLTSDDLLSPHAQERQDRINALEEINFIWNVYDYKWNLKFAQLIDYYEQYGHTNVPASHPTLGNWVKNQRSQYAQLSSKGKSRLTAPHAVALNRLGFDWNRRKTLERLAEERFWKRVQEYSSSETSPKLQEWVARQRKVYRKWLQGLGELPENRRVALEEMGLVNDIVQED